jgi:hypothetical protein
MEYKKAYNILFNAITDALAELGKASKTAEIIKVERILKSVQQQTEAMYIEAKSGRRRIHTP